MCLLLFWHLCTCVPGLPGQYGGQRHGLCWTWCHQVSENPASTEAPESLVTFRGHEGKDHWISPPTWVMVHCLPPAHCAGTEHSNSAVSLCRGRAAYTPKDLLHVNKAFLSFPNPLSPAVICPHSWTKYLNKEVSLSHYTPVIMDLN